MEKIKLQICCMILILFVGVIFFRVKRVKTKSGNCFGILIIMTIINLVFDMITVYTVNHLDTVSPLINRICHDFFLESIILCLFFCARYIFYMIRAEINSDGKMSYVGLIPLIISTIVIIFGPLDYMVTDKGNYSYGMAANMCYVSMAIYFVMSCVYMIVNYKKINSRKRAIIMVSLGIFLIAAIYQAIIPTSLVSGFGLTLVVFAISLTVESPDMHLIELLQIEKRRADNANEAKSNFLAQMSHEIRTPINAILGMDEMILREYDEPQLNEYAVTINNASRTLLNLVNDVLDFSKIEAGKMELLPQNYELSSLCGDLIEMIKPRIKDEIEFQVEIDETLPEDLYGDDIKIKQIITNLLTNAAKYTMQGKIIFRIEKKQIQDECILMDVQVRDTGIGIKEDDIPKLFESFKRIEENRNRNIEGTGLGMNITISYLKLMGSELEVESKYGEGSVFSFELRQKIAGQELIGNFNKRYKEVIQNRKNAHKDSFSAPDAKVLVVDDNETNRMVFQNLLKNTLMTVVAVGSGKACLEEICNQHYDMIFLDHMMPEMDGIETFHRMTNLDNNMCKETPIIALTANAITGAKEKYLSEGFTDYLSKPVMPEKLEKIVLAYLHKDKIKPPIEVAAIAKQDGLTIATLIDRISGMNSEMAMANCVNEETLLQAIEGFCINIDKQIDIIRNCVVKIEQPEYLKRYVTEVHSMKSSIRLLGGINLADMAQNLENAGNAEDTSTILENTEILLGEAEKLKLKLEMCIPNRQTGTIIGSPEEINDLLEQLAQAMEILDVDMADNLIGRLSQYYWDENDKSTFEQLSNMVLNLEVEQCNELINLLRREEG